MTPYRNVLFLAASLAVALSACTKQAPSTQVPRPVRVAVIADSPGAVAVFAGEVRARYESKVGFRVGGKIVRRAVNVGDRLRAGQLIAELDPADYRLAAEALDAQLRAARSDHEFAASDLSRYRELLQEKLIAPAEYDRRETSASMLRDRVAALTAQVEQARLQTQYTRLVAEHDSVVVSLPAEVDQVVAAGQPVAVLARLLELEVAIDVPEALRASLEPGAAASVRFWAAPESQFEGRVREVAASADSASRTYAVRVALPRREPWVRIGMSTTVVFPRGVPTGQRVIPLSAVFVPQGDPGGASRVWVVGEDDRVRSVPITLGAPVGASEVQAVGLATGLKIVTAGASRLREGDAVSVLAPFAVGGSLAKHGPRSGPGAPQGESTAR